MTEPKKLVVYQEYHDYMKSEKWTKIRTKVFSMAGWKCQVCTSKKGINAHHNSYKNLYNETSRDLVVLCHECHDLFHAHQRLLTPMPNIEFHK